MATGKWEPLRDLANIQDKINKIFNETLSQSRLSQPKTFTGWMPATDLVEKKDCFALSMEVPGLKNDTLEIHCEGHNLVISGKRPFAGEMKEEDYSLLESPRGSFRRTFALPEIVDTDAIEAELSNGLLKLTVPKAGMQKAHKIEIKTK